MSQEKLYYKQFVDDYDSDTFEEFLTQKLVQAEKEIEELKAEIHRKSIKYSSRREADEKIKADYRDEIKRAYHAILFDEVERAKTVLANAIGDTQ